MGKTNILIIFLRLAFVIYVFFRFLLIDKPYVELLNFNISWYGLPVLFAIWNAIILLLQKMHISGIKTIIIVVVDLFLAFLLSLTLGAYDAVFALTFPALELSGAGSLAPSIIVTLISLLVIFFIRDYKEGFHLTFFRSYKAVICAFYTAVVLACAYVIDLYNKQITQNQMLVNLLEIGQRMTSALTYDKIFDVFSRIVKSIFPYSGFALYLVKKEDSTMLKVYAADLPPGISLTDCSCDVPDSVLAMAVKEARPILVEDLHRIQEVVIPQEKHMRSLAVIPLSCWGNTLGAFFVAHSSPGFLLEGDLRILSILANQLAVCVRNIHLHETAALLSITDSVSGLYTQRYFQQQLGDLLVKAKYENKPLSVIIMDVDFFKQVNDTYGHPEGDFILKQMGGILKEQTRDSDVVARYGGDEFCMVFVNSDKVSATITAERIRSVVERYEFTVGSKIIRITISGGVATFPEDAQTKKELIQKADAFLYEAKKKGRNKICVG